MESGGEKIEVVKRKKMMTDGGGGKRDGAFGSPRLGGVGAAPTSESPEPAPPPGGDSCEEGRGGDPDQ